MPESTDKDPGQMTINDMLKLIDEQRKEVIQLRAIAAKDGGGVAVIEQREREFLLEKKQLTEQLRSLGELNNTYVREIDRAGETIAKLEQENAELRQGMTSETDEVQEAFEEIKAALGQAQKENAELRDKVQKLNAVTEDIAVHSAQIGLGE